MNSQEVELAGGHGFYTKIVLKNPSLIFEGERVKLELHPHTGHVALYVGSRIQISLLSTSITVLAREPVIEVNGKVLFKEFYEKGYYGGHLLMRKLRATGHDALFTGYIKLHVIVSDVYSAATLSFRGYAERIPPLVQWDELHSFLRAVPFFIIEALILMVVTTIRRIGSVRYEA